MKLSIHIARRNYGQGEDRRYRAQKRLQRKAAGDLKSHRAAQRRFMAAMCRSPIAVHVDKPKEQRYELPSEFFRQVLGQRMKYNSCYWPDGITNLDTAEDAMLALTCERCQIADGMKVLELGSTSEPHRRLAGTGRETVYSHLCKPQICL